MQELKFSYNWNNKLNCRYFTTIRLSNRFRIGEVVEVVLKGKKINSAKCVDKKETKLGLLSTFECYLDTGYNVEQTKNILAKMYIDKDWDKTPVFIYLFQNIGEKEAESTKLF